MLRLGGVKKTRSAEHPVVEAKPFFAVIVQISLGTPSGVLFITEKKATSLFINMLEKDMFLRKKSIVLREFLC